MKFWPRRRRTNLEFWKHWQRRRHLGKTNFWKIKRKIGFWKIRCPTRAKIWWPTHKVDSSQKSSKSISKIHIFNSSTFSIHAPDPRGKQAHTCDTHVSPLQARDPPLFDPIWSPARDPRLFDLIRSPARDLRLFNTDSIRGSTQARDPVRVSA